MDVEPIPASTVPYLLKVSLALLLYPVGFGQRDFLLPGFKQPAVWNGFIRRALGGPMRELLDARTEA